MMHLLVLYDVSNDRTRTKIATTCEDYGLDRIQYSAFSGRLNRNLQEELMLRISDLLADQPGRVQLVPVSSDDWRRRIEVENA